MAKFLKENWFVAVIAAFFLCISIFYAVSTTKDNLPGKTANGKDVVFSVDDTNVTADELYDELFKTYGKNNLFLKFFEGVIDASVKEDSAMTTEINNSIASTINYYAQQGYNEEYLNQLSQYYYGYPTFREYVKYSIKGERLYASYIEEHKDEYVTDAFIAENSPRVISYCLIKMDKPAEPTAEETDRLNAAKDACNSDKYNVNNFDEFAKKFSEDTSTAPNGGKLGYMDKDAQLVEAFLKAALALKEGEVSEWVYDSNYGYFLIKCDSTSYEDFKSESAFVSAVISANEGLSNKIIWEQSQNINATFPDESVKQYIMSQLNVEGEGK